METVLAANNQTSIPLTSLFSVLRNAQGMGLQPFPASLESSCHLLSPQVSEQQLLSTFPLGAWLWESDISGLSPSCQHRTVLRTFVLRDKWENICAASESPGCWRVGSCHHNKEDRGSGNGQGWVQNIPVRLCHEVGTSASLMLWPLEGHCQPWPLMQTVNRQHHLQCLRTRPWENSTRADMNIST